MTLESARKVPILSLFLSAVLPPKPEEKTLVGCPHILSSTEFLIKISRADENRIFTPLLNALKSANTEEANSAASQFNTSLLNPDSLFVLSKNQENICLNKSALRNLRSICENLSKTELPDEIKNPIDIFLKSFPDDSLDAHVCRHNNKHPSNLENYTHS